MIAVISSIAAADTDTAGVKLAIRFHVLAPNGIVTFEALASITQNVTLSALRNAVIAAIIAEAAASELVVAASDIIGPQYIRYG